LNSLVTQIGDDYEVVVVDNFSKDGTFEILQKYKDDPRIKLLQRRCNRGLGRQTAFEHSSGDYVISNLDMDDIFLPTLPQFVQFYHLKCDGKVLLANAGVGVTTQNVTMSPRDLLKDLGGWRDLQWSEDWDLWCRAAKASRYAWTVFKLVDVGNQHLDRRAATKKMRVRYSLYRDMLRVGRRPFSKGEHVNLSQRLAYFFALLSARLSLSYEDNFKNFDPYDPHFYIK